MKGYIYVYDQRSAYLKKLFLENGVELVNSIEDEADFYFVKNQKLNRKNVFSLSSLNQNYHFRHLNNMLTAMGIYLKILQEKRNHSILILGFGDLGKQLANLLKNQYDVTICNRNYKDYDQIIQNYKHIDFENLRGTYDLIINTIPHVVIDYQNVSYQKIIDLAQTLELQNYQSIRNVPERSFPYEAALLMYDTIQEVMHHV
ncbi:MAG: hypothetical protein Q4Q31_07680 [Bacillota bacterium]|nr:hypothetical protein [Bacillota bacterium]